MCIWDTNVDVIGMKLFYVHVHYHIVIVFQDNKIN